MRRILWSLTALLLLAALLPGAGPLGGSALPAAEAQGTIDDELVILTNTGLIVVEDPHTPPGYQQVVWDSGSTGWQNVATGDFNGDGTDEIIATRSGVAYTFDPIPSAIPVPNINLNLSGQVWEEMVTGDIDSDGRDEIILTHTTSEGDIIERMLAYELNSAGTTWVKLRDEGYGVPWQHLATGDVNGDGDDEVAAIRHRLNPTDKRITIWDPSNNWTTLHNRGSYDFKWLTIEIGDTVADSENKEELNLTREGVLGTLPSFLVMRCCSGSDLQVIEDELFFPYFFDVALGDVNNSGDDEVFLLRNTAGTGSVALIMLNYGNDSTNSFQTLTGEGKWRKIHTGDLDADGRAELVVMAADEFRIYWSPEANLDHERRIGSYISSGRFAVGNIDGPGIPEGPALSISDTSFEFNLQAGEPASASVNVTNSGDGTVFGWTAAVTQGGNWLSINPAAGSTPGTLTMNINTANLLSGSYTGTVQVTADPGVSNSPQNITVELTLTAPEFWAQPSRVSWFQQQGLVAPTRTVRVYGPTVPWYAGTVPVPEGAAIAKAVAEGAEVRLEGDRFVIDDGRSTRDVPIVDYVSITPISGVSAMDGSPVLLDLVTDRVPWGLSRVSLVFIAAQPANPPAVIVDLTIVAYASYDEFFFMPSMNR